MAEITDKEEGMVGRRYDWYMARIGKTMTTYRGHLIVRCNWAQGQHGGEWYVQTRHSPTGMAWSDEECPHFDSIAGAKDYIQERGANG